MSLTKIVMTNVLIFIFLIGAVLLSPPIIYAAYSFIKSGKNSVQDTRAKLKIYDEFAWATRHFQELSQLKIEYHDFIVWKRKNFSGDTINIRNGIRKSIELDDNFKDKKEILFFGGSTTWGSGVSDEFTYPSIFSRKFSIKVENNGESGYTARQSLALLQNKLIKKAADEFGPENKIVFYDGVNDVVHRCRSEITGLGTGHEDQIRNRLAAHGFKWSFARTFSQLKDLISTGHRKIKSMFLVDHSTFYSCAKNPERAQEIAATIVSTWRQANVLANHYEMDFYAILQPVAFLGNPKIDYLDLTKPVDLELARQYEAVYPIIRKLAKLEDYNFIDLSAVYDGCNDCYIDFCHTGPQAHVRLADAIAFHILDT